MNQSWPWLALVLKATCCRPLTLLGVHYWTLSKIPIFFLEQGSKAAWSSPAAASPGLEVKMKEGWWRWRKCLPLLGCCDAAPLDRLPELWWKHAVVSVSAVTAELFWAGADTACASAPGEKVSALVELPKFSAGTALNFFPGPSDLKLKC